MKILTHLSVAVAVAVVVLVKMEGVVNLTALNLVSVTL